MSSQPKGFAGAGNKVIQQLVAQAGRRRACGNAGFERQ